MLSNSLWPKWHLKFMISQVDDNELFHNIYLQNFILYIYCHPQTDCFIVSQLFNVTRHIGCLKLGLKPTQLYVRLSIIPLSQQVNPISSRIVMHYVVSFVCLHFCFTRYQSAQLIQRALYYACGSRKATEKLDSNLMQNLLKVFLMVQCLT